MRLRWIHDVFGNSVAIATFDERADPLTFNSTVTVDHNPAEEFALTPDDHALISIPSSTTARSFPISGSSSRRNIPIPAASLSAWARSFLDAEAPTPTFKILSGDDAWHPRTA